VTSPATAADDYWSTPIGAPLVPRFPIAYRKVRILTTAYRSDSEAIRRALPQALNPVSDVVLIHQYRMPDVQAMGRVTETNVMIGATLADDPSVIGGFTVALLISSDVGLAQGREVHGQPKKLGTTRVRAEGDLLVGTSSRNGVRVIRVTTPYKERQAELPELLSHFDFRTNLNLKVIPNIDESPGMLQITSRTLRNVSVRELWRGRATVELRPNAQLPVHELPVVEPLEAFYWRADFELGPGTVVRDLR
jgi:acetoacetate decarboxylase